MQSALKKNSTRLIFTSVVLSLALLVIISQSYTKPLYIKKLGDVVGHIQIFDRAGVLLTEGNLDALRNQPMPETSYLLRTEIPEQEFNQSSVSSHVSLYITPLIVPLRMKFDNEIIESHGSFEYQRPPIEHDILFQLPEKGQVNKLYLEFLLTSASKDHFLLFNTSGLANTKDITLNLFVKSFITRYGYLGLSCVYLTLAFALFVIWVNFGKRRELIFLSLTNLVMAVVSLFFSRITFELPFMRILNTIYIPIYLLIMPFIAMTCLSWIHGKRARQITLAIALIGFGFALLQSILIIWLPIEPIMEIYKIQLILSIVAWLALTLLSFLYLDRKSLGQNYVGAVVPLAIAIITLGQANDCLRIYFREHFLYNLGPYFWFVATLLLLATITNSIYTRYEKALTDEKTQAIAQTTQMLAHDVRKPFTLLENLLNIFRNCREPEKLRLLATEHIPTVQTALASVNAMIHDIMEINGAAKSPMEPISPESLIEISLHEVCRIHPNKAIPISYQFKHKSMILANSLKAQRAFSNIITNAFQAIASDGTIWFHTRDIGNPLFVEFIIGNSGSHIPDENIPKLFDAFFTENKRNGTGLGLAIAKKIVTDHGGEIWCESIKVKKQVEFHVLIPVAKNSPYCTTAKLPTNSREISECYNHLTSTEELTLVIKDPRESKAEELIFQWVKNLDRPLKLGFIDDENLYRSNLCELIRSCKKLDKALNLSLFTRSDELFDYLQAGNTLDFLICDLDLGAQSLDGFSLVAELRRQGFCNPICIHSNRNLPDDIERAIQVGAQTFLPKPLSRIHLLKFMSAMLSEGQFKPHRNEF